MRHRLLQFVTGTSRVPMNGFSVSSLHRNQSSRLLSSKMHFFCRNSMDPTDHRSFASKRLEVKKAFQWLTPALTGLFIWKRPSDQNFCQVGPASLHFLSNPQVQTCSCCGGIAGLRWSGLVKQFSIQQRDSLSDSPPKRIPWIHWKVKTDWRWNFDYQKVKVTNKPLAKVINACSQIYYPL